MSFEPAQSSTPLRRGAVSIRLFIPDPQVPAGEPHGERYGTLTAEVFHSDGRCAEKRFDLLERLDDDAAGQTHKSNLLALETYILDRLDTEVVGIE